MSILSTLLERVRANYSELISWSRRENRFLPFSTSTKKHMLIVHLSFILFVVPATLIDPEFQGKPWDTIGLLVIFFISSAVAWPTAVLAHLQGRKHWAWFVATFLSSGIATIIIFFLPSPSGVGSTPLLSAMQTKSKGRYEGLRTMCISGICFLSFLAFTAFLYQFGGIYISGIILMVVSCLGFIIGLFRFLINR